MVMDGVRYRIKGNDTYFYVDDIRDKYDFIRVLESKITYEKIDGKFVALVKTDDWDILSDFDLLMLRSRKFPPES